jgi:hypothetical protein
MSFAISAALRAAIFGRSGRRPVAQPGGKFLADTLPNDAGDYTRIVYFAGTGGVVRVTAVRIPSIETTH